jgi:hypothetical protein
MGQRVDCSFVVLMALIVVNYRLNVVGSQFVDLEHGTERKHVAQTSVSYLSHS